MTRGILSKITAFNLLLLLSSLFMGFLILRLAVGFMEEDRRTPLFPISKFTEEEIRDIVSATSPGIYRPTSDPDVGYLLQPHIDKEAFRTRILTNGAGLRGATIDAKQPGVTRIVCLGDSHTFGYKVEEDEAYPFQLGEMLEVAKAGQFEVLNCSVPSWNIRAEAAWLRARLSFLEPDYVVWQIFDNDLWSTFGVGESGFATMDFSPQERERGRSYYTGPSEIYSSSLATRVERAARSIRVVADLLASQEVGLHIYFISSKEPALANFLQGFVAQIGEIPATIHPDRYTTNEYRLDWDPHFNPVGNYMVALGVAWSLRGSLGLEERELPDLPHEFSIGTNISQLADQYDLESVRTNAWKKVPSRIVPYDTDSLHYSIGLLKFGWVCKEFETLIQTPSPGLISIQGEFLAYPQITPLTLQFSIGDATEVVKLTQKGSFKVEIRLPVPRKSEEAKYGGTLLRCQADKYCSTLYDHRMLSWVLKEITFVRDSL